MEPQSPFDLPNDLIDPTEPASPFARDPEPRLGIVHLLAWIGCTAFYLGLQQTISNTQPEMQSGIFASPGYLALRVAFGLGMGIAVASLFLWATRRWQGVPFPVHPGEFLAVLQGVFSLIFLASFAVYLSNIGEIGSTSWGVAVVLGLPMVLSILCLAIWAACSVRSIRWRVFFVVFAVLTCGRFAVMFLSSIYFGNWMSSVQQLALSGWPVLAMPIMLTIALIGDRRYRQKRPWTHWVGIGMQGWLWLAEWVLPRLMGLY